MNTSDRPAPASELRAALNAFDPERSLSTRAELNAYFVERPLSPILDLAYLLRDAESPQKILFTGHRGSGKSTELAKLASELGDEFFIVSYSVHSVINPFDITYVDVILSLALELFRQTTDRHVSIRDDVLDKVLGFTREITTELETTINERADLGAELNLYVVKLASKIGTEDVTRQKIRETLQHRLSDLLESVQILTKDLERALNKRILVIVEDLDKTDLTTARQLFHEHAQSIFAPPVSIIYTFPTALRHDNGMMQLEANCSDVYILPNIAVETRGGGTDPEGSKRIREVVGRRARTELFEADALDSLAELSGGIPRELLFLARRAVLEARKAHSEVVTSQMVTAAAKSKRMDYQVLLTSDHIDLLREVRRTRRVENDETYQALLHNLSVLEYRDDVGLWHDVHPIVRPLLT